MAILYPPRSLLAKERLDYWSEVVCATYGLTTQRTLSDTPFDGRLSANTLGDILLTHISSAPIEYESRQTDSGVEQFFLCFTLSTEAELEQRGRRSVQARGDIVLFNSAEPYRCRFPKGDDQIVIAIPRERLIQHLPRPEALVSRTLDSHSALARLAGNMMIEVLDTGPQQTRAGERLSGALLEVLATAFEGAFDLADLGHSSRHDAQLMKAKDFCWPTLRTPGWTSRPSHKPFMSPRAHSAACSPWRAQRPLAGCGSNAFRLAGRR